MNKQEFIKLMKELVAIKKAEDNLIKAFKKFEPEFSRISFSRYETLVVNSLVFGMNDEHNWINYWIYDWEMGKRDGNVEHKGQKIPSKTLSNLYDLITNRDI